VGGRVTGGSERHHRGHSFGRASALSTDEPGRVIADWNAVVPRMEKAKGIIFDMRGYPGQPGIQSLAHLTGILPTVPASRTRKGVAEGKDEILLKGVEVVKSQAR